MAFSDVVILLPGISGSALTKDGKVLWGTGAGGIWNALTTFGDSIRSLALSGDDDPTLDDLDGVVATSLVQDLHLIPGFWKIDGYTKVREHLVSTLALRPGANFFEFPYDWRRDNRVASRKLARFARERLQTWRESSGAGDAKLVFIAHSMGGLVARGFIDGPEQGWVDTRALITLGTPHRGSLNALGFLANGFSAGVGRLRFDFSDTLRSFTGVYQLLPRFACVDRGNGQLVRPSETAGLPHIDPERARAALGFYEELEEWHARSAALPGYLDIGPKWYPVTGTFQRTMLSARLAGGALTLLQTLAGSADGGDGTVPRGSATPLHMEGTSAGMFANQVHGSLQNDPAILDHVTAIAAGLSIDTGAYRATFNISLQVEDVYAAEAPVRLTATSEPRLPTLNVDLYDASRPPTTSQTRVGTISLADQGDGELVGEAMLSPGAYRAVVAEAGAAPVADTFLVVKGG